VVREFQLLAGALADRERGRIEELIRAMNQRGVAPLDVSLGNVLIGAETGRPYWIDFEWACLRPLPCWGRHLRQCHQLFVAGLGLSLSQGGAGTPPAGGPSSA
jgi:hypothetical protein